MRLQDVLHRVAGLHLAKVAGRANVALLLGREARAVANWARLFRTERRTRAVRRLAGVLLNYTKRWTSLKWDAKGVAPVEKPSNSLPAASASTYVTYWCCVLAILGLGLACVWTQSSRLLH